MSLLKIGEQEELWLIKLPSEVSLPHSLNIQCLSATNFISLSARNREYIYSFPSLDSAFPERLQTGELEHSQPALLAVLHSIFFEATVTQQPNNSYHAAGSLTTVLCCCHTLQLDAVALDGLRTPAGFSLEAGVRVKGSDGKEYKLNLQAPTPNIAVTRATAVVAAPSGDAVPGPKFTKHLEVVRTIE